MKKEIAAMATIVVWHDLPDTAASPSVRTMVVLKVAVYDVVSLAWTVTMTQLVYKTEQPTEIGGCSQVVLLPNGRSLALVMVT
jgi:hypothetical protein